MYLVLLGSGAIKIYGVSSGLHIMTVSGKYEFIVGRTRRGPQYILVASDTILYTVIYKIDAESANKNKPRSHVSGYSGVLSSDGERIAVRDGTYVQPWRR